MPSLTNRLFKPAVRFDSLVGSIFNLDADGIRFTWDILRDNTNNPDQAVIEIYNLSTKVSGALYEAWQTFVGASGFLVTFSLGWDGVPKKVLVGDVFKLTPNSRTPTDVITIIEIGDGNQNTRDQVVGRSFSNVNISIVLDYLVSLPPAPNDAGGGGLGLIYTPESKAVVAAAAAELPIQNWGNIPAGSNTRDAITLIMDTLGLQWRVSNGEFIAMRGRTLNRPPLILAPRSGLLHWDARDDGGIEIQAYGNPEAEPGLQILAQDDLGRPVAEPAYRIESVHFRGDTRADSLMTISARKSQLAA